MAAGIPFYKMVASGNDFVVVDNRRGIVRDAFRFARTLCEPHRGVGADGLLLFENSKKADFKMRIVNSDGSEAEACGNGFRCVALYAKEKLGYPADFRFESLAGPIQAHVNGRRVRVELVTPKDFRDVVEIEVLGRTLRYSFINTGVPHVVIFVEGLKKIDVEGLGRTIREHAQFRPRGTNVNFVEVKAKNKIEVRTYERGVEGETLACGTGTAAAALVSSLKGLTRPPVEVKTQGGEVLTVDFKRRRNRVTRVTLEGEAHFVYEGKWLPNR